MWADLMHVQIPLLEKVLRTVAVYGGIAVLLRIGGKRDLAELNSFDLVVMLLLSNVVQNAVIGNDNSLAGGLLGAAVLIALNAVVVRVVNRHPRLVRVFEGTPTVLVRDGKPVPEALHRLGLRRADVVAACHRQGAGDLSEVKEAVLEPGGSIVVTLREEAQDVTVAQLRAENARLRDDLHALMTSLEERLEARLAALGPARGE